MGLYFLAPLTTAFVPICSTTNNFWRCVLHRSRRGFSFGTGWLWFRVELSYILCTHSRPRTHEEKEIHHHQKVPPDFGYDRLGLLPLANGSNSSSMRRLPTTHTLDHRWKGRIRSMPLPIWNMPNARGLDTFHVSGCISGSNFLPPLLEMQWDDGMHCNTWQNNVSVLANGLLLDWHYNLVASCEEEYRCWGLPNTKVLDNSTLAPLPHGILIWNYGNVTVVRLRCMYSIVLYFYRTRSTKCSPHQKGVRLGYKTAARNPAQQTLVM